MDEEAAVPFDQALGFHAFKLFLKRGVAGGAGVGWREGIDDLPDAGTASGPEMIQNRLLRVGGILPWACHDLGFVLLVQLFGLSCKT